MKTNYILIDFENVQPKNLGLLKGHPFKILVFVGANQTKIPFEMASVLQSFGSDAEYVRIEGNGPNALDFHIAYYLGILSQKEPDAFFHVISKDSGFDPLVKFLKGRKVRVLREKELIEIPLLKVSNSKTLEEKIDAVVSFLKLRNGARPRTVKTLSNSISTLFMKNLPDQELNGLLEMMVERGLIVIKESKVAYSLPGEVS